MALPIAMPIGHIFEHLGTRIRFEANMGETLLFRDCRDLSVYMPYDEDAGRKIPPTEAWLHRELAAGRLPSPGSKPEGAADRQKRFAGLDRPACEARDPKLAMKERWVWAAREEDPVRTDAAFKEFISRRAADVQQKGEPLPTAASLRRWVRKKEIGENGASDLLNLAGRERGRSQLCSALDDIVHQSALYYWAAPNASIGDAESFMDGQWSQLTPEQLPDGAKRPSYETVRLRVRSLETRATHETKYGKASADKKYGASGESVPVTRCFERVYLDGVELEQAVVMDDDWALPGGKMKSVVCIDALSSFVFEPCTFAGPYRSETSMQALSNMMTPPILTDEEYAEDPELAWANGVPNTLVPDNAQTLIGPGHVPGLNELGITLELLGTYHHDAKSPIENFNKYLKQSLRGLPGTIRGPRQPKHPQDDPLADASLTREALAQIVKSVVRKWNTTPKAPLGNRSPAQFLHADLLANPRPLRCNPEKIRRALTKTVNGRILTGDGVEYDGIVYRGELDIEDFIERNLRNTAFADRLPDEGKCIVSIRVYEGDLDLIEVYDPEALGFITLRSTQPAYTGMLTKWEHDQYKALAKRRKEQFKTEDQRIRSRTRSLAEIDRLAPEVSFQARAAMVALYANEKVRRLSGAKGETKGYVCPIPEMFFEIEPATELRQDLATPPPGAVNPPPKKKHFAPERIDGFHSGEAGGDDASFSWDDLADDDQAGPVPNESNATVWDDETIDEEDDE